MTDGDSRALDVQGGAHGRSVDRQPSALDLATQWASLPPEHLRIALKALEPQLAREHELRLEQERAAERMNVALAENAAREGADRRAHIRYLSGLWAGLVISLFMLTGAVVVGTAGQPWLAAALSGPSMLALARIFVLRRSDPEDLREAGRVATGGTTPDTPPGPAPDPGPRPSPDPAA
ncbi:hypothetical protein [Streptomyces sp. HPF1205]|uniref:hypothetical protein n=1 Tax=Streptomyces sp. HPF1205 TaxID=2873262 RepID=UPI001CECD107|nr:hypothetical protein [Streptomyces sp. HPF1205]